MMKTAKEVLNLSIISETNYSYAFSDNKEAKEDAKNQIKYGLEIPVIDFQSIIDLFIVLKQENIECVHYYCSKVIPFDTEAPVNVWNHFSTIEKNSLRNRGIGMYEKPMYIFYVKDFSSFLILSIRHFDAHVEDKLNRIFDTLN